MAMRLFPSTTFVIEARLVSPSASEFALSRVPPRVHAYRPLEVELASIGQGVDTGTAESVASWISAHALLHISVEAPGEPQREVSVLVKARLSGGRWIARALVRPAAWANAVSVTVHSMSLAGRPVPCDCLPATLRVGYNHAPAPEGAIFAAATAGDVPALQAAIEAGGSTEEADEVRQGGVLDPWGSDELADAPPPLRALLSPPPSRSPSFCCRMAELALGGPPPKATSRPSARSWRQAPVRPQ